MTLECDDGIGGLTVGVRKPGILKKKEHAGADDNEAEYCTREEDAKESSSPHRSDRTSRKYPFNSVLLRVDVGHTAVPPATELGRVTCAERRIVCESSDSRRSRSSIAFPRKYSSRESCDGFVMLTWTTRETAARRAASKRMRVLLTACEYRKSA